MVNIMLINIDPENHHFLMETSLQPLSARDGYHHMSSSAGIMTFPMYWFFLKKKSKPPTRLDGYIMLNILG